MYTWKWNSTHQPQLGIVNWIKEPRQRQRRQIKIRVQVADPDSADSIRAARDSISNWTGRYSTLQALYLGCLIRNE